MLPLRRYRAFPLSRFAPEGGDTVGARRRFLGVSGFRVRQFCALCSVAGICWPFFFNLVLGMTDPIDDEENYPPRPRWMGWLIGLVMAASALGVANIGWRIMRVSTAEKAADALVAAKPELAAARKLVEGADCMRCHGLDRKFVGPGFTEIAQKYGSQADAQSYLADKIRSGSVGVWGNVIMPRHPQISEADSLQMARWVLSAQASAAAAQ